MANARGRQMCLLVEPPQVVNEMNFGSSAGPVKWIRVLQGRRFLASSLQKQLSVDTLVDTKEMTLVDSGKQNIDKLVVSAH